MNWAAVGFDWNQVRAFLATAEEGSLSAAARALGQSQPTIGRQVAALEEDLGVVLFERVGRSLELTPTGRDLLDHVRAMGDAAGRISLLASGRSQAIEGRVSISASDVMSTLVLPPILARLREVAPGITVEVVASNAVSDLQRREADIALRHVRPEAPELFARLLREIDAHLYASPTYLERRGRPATLEDIADHDLIGFSDNVRLIDEYRARGLPVSQDQIRFGSADGNVAWSMTRAGLGISPMADTIAGCLGGVEQVLPDFVITFPVWLAVHREVQTSKRIRLVFDLLARELQVV
ncbi:MAG: LysR family transcriptional regulator [Pseudomonadota bacterium]